MSYSVKEGKKEFKNKVGQLMQEYERSKKEQQQQKLQLKQNVMLQILQNRHQLQKEQRKSQTTNTALSEPQPQETQLQNIPTATFQPLDLKPILANTHSAPKNIQPVSEHHSRNNQLQQITFSMKKRNQSFQNEDSFHTEEQPELDIPQPPPKQTISEQKQNLQQSESKQKIPEPKQKIQESEPKQKIQESEPEEDEEENYNRSINRIAKYANKYFPEDFKSSLQKKEEPQDEEEQPQSIRKLQNFSKNNPSYRFQEEKPASSHFFQEKQPSHFSSSFKQKSKYSPPKETYNKEEAQYDKQEEQPEEVEQNIQQQGGVFLTMEESESMTASELPKQNVAFEIKMDKSVDPDHFEELRKQKIKQMEKKRQERITEYRKNQAQKKVEMPRGRSSHVIKTQKLDTLEVELPPKSIAVDRKSNLNRPPKIQNKSERDLPPRNQCIPLDSHQSHYQMKQSRTSKTPKYNKKEQFVQVEESNYRPVSPARTPKTIVSENRPKSSYKNSNIFTGQSQYVREKSSSRCPEPKIEPKDRKYSFSRQSNKKLMINAITYVVFPGQLNRKDRQRLIDVLESSEYQFFVFLFKEYSRKIIKGIYTLDNSQTRLERIYGEKSPFEITADRVQQFYRFDSGSRQFKKVTGCRSFSYVIHAIDLR